MIRLALFLPLLALAACGGSEYYTYSSDIHDAPVSNRPIALDINLVQAGDLQYLAWCALESASGGEWTDSLSQAWGDAYTHKAGDSLHDCYVVWRERPIWPITRSAHQWDSNLKN